MTRFKSSFFAVPFVAAALSLGSIAPVSAQTQEGLVNVNVSDIDLGLNVNVQVPVAIAANVCDVDVNVLARQQGGGGNSCEATADSAANNDQFMRFAERANPDAATEIRNAVGG
jgi:hypothetical protein